MRRRGTPFGSPRAAALALGLVLAAGFALPLLVCVLAATAGPEAVAGPSVAEESSAALGGVQRLLHGDGSVRFEPVVLSPEPAPALPTRSAAEGRGGPGSVDPSPSAPPAASASRRL